MTGPGDAVRSRRVLLLGGTSEIGLAILAALAWPADTEVLLAGRDLDGLARAGTTLPYQVRAVPYDALTFGAHRAFVQDVFGGGPVDLVISAAGVLIPQPELDQDPGRAATLIGTNLTGHVTTLLACADQLGVQGHGTIVVLSSVAAVRPRRANLVYGAAKAGLDAFARGLADAAGGRGVRVLLVRPGFVTGRMTAGMSPAPLATTPAAVGLAVAAALGGSRRRTAWVPRRLKLLATAMRLVPRPLWRRLTR
ncbi:MAG TPA: SDR family NAD(P)-dependent oxidoreductase [Streptosporangiaceae bacterium]|nr:SDR family NAD(P)-dependent oxidoreductase [Streptosporangiaceae bacterium]